MAPPAHHSWFYELPPRQATERTCRKCSLECRRPDGQAWKQALLEFRFPGGQWQAVAGYVPCGGRAAGIAAARAETARRTGQ